MRKIFSFLCIISVIPLSPIVSIAWAEKESEKNYFVVTAYYSPLPNQEHYLTWDYESEKRLNGQGIAWASGKKVFSGMLAAPSKYGFWTKIYLEWLWVWVVEDRGGAIVPAGQRGYSYDRLDVWMGYGDEWLKRALYWWKRTIEWNVVGKNDAINLDYNQIPAPSWAIQGLEKKYSKKNISVSQEKKKDIFQVSLGKWSDKKLIQELQEILNELEYLKTDYKVGIYDSVTISSVYNFQKEFSIIQNESDLWAWSYGPQTRKKLEEVYWEYLEKKAEHEAFLKVISNLQESAFLKAEKEVSDLWKPQIGDISPEVRKLQVILRNLWFFARNDTAIYGPVTQNALIEYQLNREIILEASEIWAWNFWPMTRAKFIQDLSEIYFKESIIKSDLEEKYSLYLWEDIKKEVKQDVSIEEYIKII